MQTVKCLIEESLLASMAGDELHIAFLPSCGVPATGRNQLTWDFLKSECEKLFFLDADLTFELGSLLKVARQPADLVAGCYRYKRNPESYPVTWLPKEELWADEKGLLEVETLPTGFMAISRKVFEDLMQAHPERHYEHDGHPLFCFFQMVFKDGLLYSEDTLFCKEWIETGGKVYLDPDVSITHWDFNIPYPGHIGQWLKNRTENERT